MNYFGEYFDPLFDSWSIFDQFLIVCALNPFSCIMAYIRSHSKVEMLWDKFWSTLLMFYKGCLMHKCLFWSTPEPCCFGSICLNFGPLFNSYFDPLVWLRPILNTSAKNGWSRSGSKINFMHKSLFPVLFDPLVILSNQIKMHFLNSLVYKLHPFIASKSALLDQIMLHFIDVIRAFCSEIYSPYEKFG